MYISVHYVAVEKIETEKKEGAFETVAVTDDFVYRGRVVQVPECPTFVDNHALKTGDTVLFAKYSPDTHEIEQDGKKIKFVSLKDILAVL